MRCSFPGCGRPTVGAGSDSDSEIDIGVAAHICAAAPGGPRFDASMTADARMAPANGIWLCQIHAKVIDSKDPKYTVALLQEWKANAEKESNRKLLYGEIAASTPLSDDEQDAKVRAAAAADLEAFKRSDRWPTTNVALALSMEGLDKPFAPTSMASVLSSLFDVVIVAPPGMGKTTALFQISEALVETTSTIPIVIPLDDWSTGTDSLLASILRRNSFRGLSEDELRSVAERQKVVLLLDGWNQLDLPSRRRARAEVNRLRIDLPSLVLLISTRAQALDVPVDGTRVEILPLLEDQQTAIATATRGDEGAQIVDQAWRTPGVRELVAIPLYLKALLDLPAGMPFPSTKEELLRGFVAAHENDAAKKEALNEVTLGFQQRYLAGLAFAATSAETTALSELSARAALSRIADQLVAAGQIAAKPEPTRVIDALVGHHLLIRGADQSSISFQHQQFQEWYASHALDGMILAGTGDTAVGIEFKTRILNVPRWEESILFACERMARGTALEQRACAWAIIEALHVDPTLAAEMIARATDQVWELAARIVVPFITSWHSAGKVDRAFRFMLRSGRPEFLEQTWPLLTHGDSQIHLAALRAVPRLRRSSFGTDAEKLLAALTGDIKRHILSEIAMHGDVAAMDLAATVAAADQDNELHASVIDAFAFRHAVRHASRVLRVAKDTTIEQVAWHQLIKTTGDPEVDAKLSQALDQRKSGTKSFERIRAIAYGQADDDASNELIEIVAEIDVGRGNNPNAGMLEEAGKIYPAAVAEGLLRRVHAGSTLPYRAEEMIAAANLRYEDDGLLEIALSNKPHDSRADAASAALGPQKLAVIVEKILELDGRRRRPDGSWDKEVGDYLHLLEMRVQLAPIEPILEVVIARAKSATDKELAELADIVYRHPDGSTGRGRPFSTAVRAEIATLVQAWGERLLASNGATRANFAAVASMAAKARSEELVPILRKLLDEDHRRLYAAREQTRQEGYLRSDARQEASVSYAYHYRHGFAACGKAAAAAMRDYLLDEDFGAIAASILAEQWQAENEPPEDSRWRQFPDFAKAARRRAVLASETKPSDDANAMLDAVDELVRGSMDGRAQRRATELGQVALSLPHTARDEIIRRLLNAVERQARAGLLAAQMSAGRVIEFDDVRQGLTEVLEEATAKPWILWENGGELDPWLQLLPFTNRPAETPAVVATLPDAARGPWRLRRLLNAFVHAPGAEAEGALFDLAVADPRLYEDHNWRDAVANRNTLTAASKMVELIANGTVRGDGSPSHWSIVHYLGRIIRLHASIRSDIYERLRRGPVTDTLRPLAQAVAEHPDEEGLLLLVQLEIERKRRFVYGRTVEQVATNRVAAEDWEGAYTIASVPIPETRRSLLAMVTTGSADDPAAACLSMIDDVRDEYGTPEGEERHPDLASGKPWPIFPVSRQDDRTINADQPVAGTKR